MAEKTNIAWTESSWNPVRGCERVSEGCRKCYAEVLAARHSYKGGWGEGLATIVKRPDGTEEARWTGVIRPIDAMLDAPLRWRTPRRIFVNSMSDLFHKDVPDDFILRVFDVMRQSENGFSRALNRHVSQHTFQILTKRPERMLDFCERLRFAQNDDRGMYLADSKEHRGFNPMRSLRHVWLGVSAEDQDTFDQRVELLGQTPAAVRFVSAEPLLGTIDVGNALDPTTHEDRYQCLDWMIVGGESGSAFRPMEIEAARWLIEQCKLSGTPVFVKQDNGPRPGMQGRFTAEEWALKEYPA